MNSSQQSTPNSNQHVINCNLASSFMGIKLLESIHNDYQRLNALITDQIFQTSTMRPHVEARKENVGIGARADTKTKGRY